MNSQPTATTEAGTVTRPRKLWVVVAGVLLVAAYAAMFIPAFSGQRINPQYGYGSMFWSGLFFYLWWRRRSKKGWQGALLGAVVGIVVFVLAAFVGGMVQHAA